MCLVTPRSGNNAYTPEGIRCQISQEGLVLTEDQVVALERAKEEKLAHGEIETHHPGYPGAQDTYYVGTIKGVGRKRTGNKL